MVRSALFIGLVLSSGLLVGCVREAETVVRGRAAAEFSCADYALDVEEVGPDVFRASGCGQELIYACQRGGVRHGTPPDAEGDDFSDKPDERAIVCSRRLR